MQLDGEKEANQVSQHPAKHFFARFEEKVSCKYLASVWSIYNLITVCWLWPHVLKIIGAFASGGTAYLRISLVIILNVCAIIWPSNHTLTQRIIRLHTTFSYFGSLAASQKDGARFAMLVESVISASYQFVRFYESQICFFLTTTWSITFKWVM